MLIQLRQFLPVAEKILDRRSDLPVLSSICVHDGFLRMTDLEITAKLPIADDRSYTIPLEMMKKIFKVNPQHLQIELQKGPILKIQFDGKTVKFPVIDPREYPEEPSDTFQEIGIWPSEIFKQIHGQLSYASTDPLRPAMNGIFVEQNAKISSCATNGHILYFLRDLDPEKKSHLQKDISVVIPRKAVGILSKFAHGMVRVFSGEKYLRFLLPDDLEITVRQIEDAFPDFRRVLDGKFPNEIKVNKKDFQKAVASAIGFANPQNHQGVFIKTNGILNLQVEDPDLESSFSTEFPILDKSGKDLKAGFNLVLLERMLKDMESEKIIWSFSEADSASLFSDPVNPNGQVILVMPLRINEGG